MKLLFSLTFLVLFITSCKKLPPSVASQLHNCEVITDTYNKFIDLTMQFDKEKIDNLPIDSLRKIVQMVSFFEERFNEEDGKLNNLLIDLDIQYQDYDELYHRKEPHNNSSMKNHKMYSKNFFYMNKLIQYYEDIKNAPADKPIERPKYEVGW